MNKKLKIVLVILCIAACISVALMTSAILTRLDDKNKFIGEWKDQDGDIHHFFSDGTFNSYSNGQIQSGIWELKDNKLVITGQGIELVYHYSFSNDGKILKLTGPQIFILTKQ